LTLQELLDQACHDFYCNIQNDNGLNSYEDKENGEVYWGKF